MEKRRLRRHPEPGEYDITYSGWAPHTCNNEDRPGTLAWLDKIQRQLDEPPVGEDEPHFLKGAFTEPGAGGFMERLLWEIGLLGGVPNTEQHSGSCGFASDLWVAVTTAGTIRGKRVHTDFQADTFLLGLAATYEWWLAKAAELGGVEDGGEATDSEVEVPTDVGEAGPSESGGTAGDDHGVEDVQ